MLADTDVPSRRLTAKPSGTAHRGFGQAVATPAVIKGLNKQCMQDVRLGAQTAWSKWVLALDAIDLLAPSDWAASREPAHVGLRALQRLVLQRVGPLKRLVCRCQFEGLLDLERARHGFQREGKIKSYSRLCIRRSLGTAKLYALPTLDGALNTPPHGRTRELIGAN